MSVVERPKYTLEEIIALAIPILSQYAAVDRAFIFRILRKR